MATAVKPLDGAEGYPRWKESVLLRLRTVRVAHVLFQDPPAGDDAANKWAHDDALCRGHILDTLSDRLFPDYVRHATAREVWDAVARTYDVDTSVVARWKFNDFQFDKGAPLLEQIAHAEALAAAADSFSDTFLAYWLARKVPEDLAVVLRAGPGPYSDLGTSFVWRAARIQEAHRLRREAEQQGKAARAVEVKRQCWTCGKSGHLARNCTASS
ncbi:uncharacterized protein [Lolium perenne]|uniref:uncharacterized protein n=1 Tax=Lolium perenne TaxID=4522 RepID=UPI003A99C7E8